MEQAAGGEPFIIAKSGKPIVKVTAIDTPVRAERRRVGFLQRELDVPHDFDEMGRSEIEQMSNAALSSNTRCIVAPYHSALPANVQK